MKKHMLSFLVLFVSLGAFAQNGVPSFKDDKVGASYQHYIHLKDALVASNVKDAKKAASELQQALSIIPNGKKAADEAMKISTESELKAQRKLFSSLSNEIATLVRGSKLSAGSIFIEYCPMANNNEGAYWLSNEKEIKNPYFGDMMLRCGSVKETLQ